MGSAAEIQCFFYDLLIGFIVDGLLIIIQEFSSDFDFEYSNFTENLLSKKGENCPFLVLRFFYV